ncbi:MAG: vitamin K epoxide reductase family protein [Thermoplasmata archaeon]|nr:vitamin K epoxide reductase family protein [Thermoplasmata archaeon]
MRAESLHALIPVALVLGLILAGYAAYETTHPAAQASCNFGSVFSCARVVNSGHTTTLGIEDYLYGIVGFLALLAIDVPLFRTWERRWLNAFLLLSSVGAAFSLYLFSIETFQIGAAG